MIRGIIRNADDKTLRYILQQMQKDDTQEKQTRDAVFSMIELMAGDNNFTASE